MALEIENNNNNILLLKPFTSKLPSKEVLHICSICSSTALYKCPKCLIRTCSSKCSKIHKEENNCDGIRPINDQQKSWEKIQGYSNFNEDITSIEDQQFLYNIKEHKNSLIKEIERSPNKKDDNLINQDLKIDNSNQKQQHKFSQSDYSLLKSAQFRRIWLLPSNNSSFDGSKIEQFSDTIFWKCTIKFAFQAVQVDEPQIVEHNEEMIESLEKVKNDKIEEEKSVSSLKPLVDYVDEDDQEDEQVQDEKQIVIDKIIENEEGEILSNKHDEEKISLNSNKDEIFIDDIHPNEANSSSISSLKWLNYTVKNIPESIKVSTLLKQFLKPKLHGTVISKDSLNLEFLQPFINASNSIIDPLNNLNCKDHLTIYSEVALPLGNDVEDNKDDDEETKSDNDDQNDAAELRYYPINPQQTILENLRNRYVVGHPCFVVLLTRENEFGEIELPKMGEIEQAILHAERERTVAIKDRPKWQNNRNNRGFRGGDRSMNKQRQHGHGGRKNGRQQINNQNQPLRLPNGQWQQQPPQGVIYNYPPPGQQHPYHFHPYMPATFIPQLNNNRGHPPPMWANQRNGRGGFGR